MTPSPGNPLRYLLAMVGFVIGVLAASGLEFLVFELFQWLGGGRIRPSGPGWLLLPIFTGIGCAKAGSTIDSVFWLRRIFGSMRRVKLYVAACCAWLLVTSYVRTWVTTVCEGRRIEAGEGLPELPEEPIRHVEQ